MVTLEVEDGLEIVRHAPVAAIVAIDADGLVVLVRQERRVVGQVMLEIPAGLMEAGEEPLAAAQRELREETGLRGGDWSELGSFYNSPGFTDERVHLFLARELEEGDNDLDDDEEVEVVRWALADVDALIGELEDAKTLAGLLLFRHHRPDS